MADPSPPPSSSLNWWLGAGALALGVAAGVLLWPRRSEASSMTLSGDPPGLPPPSDDEVTRSFGYAGASVPAAPLTGSAFAASLEGLDLAARERATVDAVIAGHVPAAFRRYRPVQLRSRGMTATFWAAPWHLAVGTDEDAFHAPLSAPQAQRICDHYGQFLPTWKMVEAIHRAPDAVHIPFKSYLPSLGHRELSTYLASSQDIERHRAGRTDLLTDYAKDFLLTSSRRNTDAHPEQMNRLAIGGAWWTAEPAAAPVQPPGLPHDKWHVDYSQKPRLIWGRVLIDGAEWALSDALSDPRTSHLFVDSGPIAPAQQRY